MSQSVYITGTFDLFHSGHAYLLKEAKKRGFVVVGLNTEEYIKTYKPLPTNSYQKRLAVLKAIKYIDVIYPNNSTFEDMTPYKTWGPGIKLMAKEPRAEMLVKKMEKKLAKFGVRIELIKKNGNHSSTAIKTHICEKQLQALIYCHREKGQSYEEIGHWLSLEREKVRQLYSKALYQKRNHF